MENFKIREALKENGLKHWELAEILKMGENTLSRKLRRELPQVEQDRIIEIIKENRKGDWKWKICYWQLRKYHKF